MTKNGKKSKNLDILSEIYYDNDNKFKKSKTNKVESIKKYFNDPKNVDKWLSGAVLFFAVFGIVFGFFHFKNQIKSPTYPSNNTDSSLLADIQAPTDLLGLREKDTDQDGLSDYDELYIYNTSPYIEDTDSDGIDDQAEIARGSDPNCPVGQDCFTWNIAKTQELFPELAPQQDDINILLSGGLTDASQIREMLRQAGTPDLDKLSDEDLLQVYQEVLRESYQTANQPTRTVVLPVNQVEDLTPQQIRELLQSSGVSADNLSQITDAELMELVAETLQEQP